MFYTCLECGYPRVPAFQMAAIAKGYPLGICRPCATAAWTPRHATNTTNQAVEPPLMWECVGCHQPTTEARTLLVDGTPRDFCPSCAPLYINKAYLAPRLNARAFQDINEALKNAGV